MMEFCCLLYNYRNSALTLAIMDYTNVNNMNIETRMLKFGIRNNTNESLRNFAEIVDIKFSVKHALNSLKKQQ